MTEAQRNNNVYCVMNLFCYYILNVYANFYEVHTLILKELHKMTTVLHLTQYVDKDNPLCGNLQYQQ